MQIPPPVFVRETKERNLMSLLKEVSFFGIFFFALVIDWDFKLYKWVCKLLNYFLLVKKNLVVVVVVVLILVELVGK